MLRAARPYLPALILLMGFAFVSRARSQEAVALTGPLASVLDDLPGYAFTDQQVSAEERQVAGMTSYVARSYERDGVVAFTTLVTYYDRQTHGKTIHSPRNCLPGAGWEIVSGGPRTLRLDGSSHSVNRYLLRNGPSTAVAYYWYQGRGRITANEYAVKWNLLRDAALMGHTEEALVRVVVPVRSSVVGGGEANVIQADSLAHVIAVELLHDVHDVLPKVDARKS